MNNITNLKVGDRLWSNWRQGILTVTELTETGFKYQYDHPWHMGSRIGTATGGEAFDITDKTYSRPTPEQFASDVKMEDCAACMYTLHTTQDQENTQEGSPPAMSSADTIPTMDSCQS